MACLSCPPIALKLPFTILNGEYLNQIFEVWNSKLRNFVDVCCDSHHHNPENCWWHHKTHKILHDCFATNQNGKNFRFSASPLGLFVSELCLIFCMGIAYLSCRLSLFHVRCPHHDWCFMKGVLFRCLPSSFCWMESCEKIWLVGLSVPPKIRNLVGNLATK